MYKERKEQEWITIGDDFDLLVNYSISVETDPLGTGDSPTETQVTLISVSSLTSGDILHYLNKKAEDTIIDKIMEGR